MLYFKELNDEELCECAVIVCSTLTPSTKDISPNTPLNKEQISS